MAVDRDGRDAISDVLIRYATGIDTKNRALFRTCFTDDVVADYSPIGFGHGVDEITGFMEVAHTTMPNTKHQMSNFVIDGDDNIAKVTSYVHAVLVLDTDPNDWADIVGHYEDEFVHTPVGWRIAKRKSYLTRFLTNGNFPATHDR